MRINAEKIFKTEGLSSDYSFSLDLSDCEFWGEYPFKTPIEVTANLSNRAGMVVLTTHATARFETGCARCTKDVVLDLPIDTENYVVTEYENQDDSSMILAEDYIIDLAEIAEFAQMFRAGGMGYGTAKTILFERVNSVLSGPRAEYERLMANTDELDAILADGAARARSVAIETMARVKRAMLG